MTEASARHLTEYRDQRLEEVKPVNVAEFASLPAVASKAMNWATPAR